MQYLKDLTEESRRKYDKHGFLLKEKVEIKSRAQKLLEALTTKVREQFIDEIRVEEELKLKTELE